MSQPPTPLRSGAFARALVRLYPRAFREEFGDEIVDFMSARAREPRYRGAWGRVRLAMELAGDTIRAAAGEHARRLTEPSYHDRTASLTGRRPRNRMDELLQDVRFALRAMVKRPGAALVVILTLMLGIGANTAIFSVVSAVLLRPLPYPEAERLIAVWGAQGEAKQQLMGVLDVEAMRERNRTLDGIGLMRPQSVNLTGGAEPDRVIGNFSTAETLALLGARTSLGRVFRPEETAIGTGQQVAVLSDAVWRTRFGSDSAIIGKTLVLNGRPHTVIGVTVPGFSDPYGPTEVWLPITSAPNAAWLARGAQSVWAVARLREGMTVEAAQRDLSAIAASLAAEYPNTNAGMGVGVQALRDSLVGNVRPILLLLLSFVGLVLLIACANVANLQLARAASRRREMALRSALGARRGRIARQLLTESLTLSIVGGVLGLLVARWATQALVAAMPTGLPVYGPIGLDARVLAFAVAVTVAAGLIFGAAPAASAARADLSDSLKLKPSDGGAGRRVDLRNAFVSLQLALCIVLLVGAGLLTRSLASLRRVDPGFEPSNVLTAEFRLPQAKYTDSAKVVAFMTRAIDAIRAVPGVRSAALVQSVPMSGNTGRIPYVREGVPKPPDGTAPMTQINTVTDGFFRTLEIPFLEGRDFDTRDQPASPPVVIVNRELARREWPNESALGKRLMFPGETDVYATVVGVVGDVKQFTLGEPAEPQVYAPMPQASGIFNSVVARTTGDPMQLEKAVRAAIWSVDPEQPVWKIRSLESLMVRDTSGARFTALLTGSFAVLALLLAAVGVYGVMSYVVAQRSREVGIRMALGGRRRQVIGMVLGRGLRLVAIATVIGIAAAVGAARLLRSMLFGVSTTDLVTFVGVPLVLALVAFVACWVPARRAARVDPMVALRSE